MVVQVPNRTYHITADTQSEQHDWIFALTTAISLLVDDSKVYTVEQIGTVGLYTVTLSKKTLTFYSSVHLLHIHILQEACAQI